jgi:hypothetical protein
LLKFLTWVIQRTKLLDFGEILMTVAGDATSTTTTTDSGGSSSNDELVLQNKAQTTVLLKSFLIVSLKFPTHLTLCDLCS